MTNPSPDLIRQVEAESVDTPQFQMLIDELCGAATDSWACGGDFGTSSKRGEAEFALIAHIDSRDAARVAAAYEAGRLAASPAAPAGFLDADELAALRRFDECAQDGEGYDVPKEMMQRLAQIGVIQRRSGAYYQSTEFGQHVLGNSALADNQAAPAKAEGWQLVPVKPTPEMLHALYVTPDFVGSTIIRHSVDKLPDAYRAMLAAAPSTPAKEST